MLSKPNQTIPNQTYHTKPCQTIPNHNKPYHTIPNLPKLKSYKVTKSNHQNKSYIYNTNMQIQSKQTQTRLSLTWAWHSSAPACYIFNHLYSPTNFVTSPVALNNLISNLITSGESLDVVFEKISTTFKSAFLSFHFLLNMDLLLSWALSWLWEEPPPGLLPGPLMLVPFKGVQRKLL